MLELASERAGGRVLMASCIDPAHPGESAIDGSDESYWMSTGLYPQELLLELGQTAAVLSVRVTSTHVRRLRIEGCQEESPVNFSVLADEELDDTHGRLQLRELGCLDCQQPIRFVRVQVMSGWFDFCSFHRIQVMGKAVAQRAEPGQHADEDECSEDFEDSASPASRAGAGGLLESPASHTGSASWGDRSLDVAHDSRRSSDANSKMAEAGQEVQMQDEGHGFRQDREDREYWLQQVMRDGWKLAEAPVAIRSDREVVLAAIAQDGLALEYAADHLRADREIVLAALNQDPWAGQYMADLQFSGSSDGGDSL